jgi:hypothetical protein
MLCKTTEPANTTPLSYHHPSTLSILSARLSRIKQSESKHSHYRQWVFVIARAVSNSLTRIIRLHNSLPSDRPSNRPSNRPSDPPSDPPCALLTHPPGNHLPPHIPRNLSQPLPSALPSDLNSDLNSALLTHLLCNLPRHLPNNLPQPHPQYLPSDLQHQHHHPYAHLTEPSRI